MPVRSAVRIFAHQGGWDEFLWIAGPLLIVGGLLWLANKRANALNESTLKDVLNEASGNDQSSSDRSS